MPHLTLEYTDNLPQFNADDALLKLSKVLIASGHFEEIDIKSRAIRLSTFLIGTSNSGRGFAHLKLAILSGRSTQAKRELSDSLLNVLSQVCAFSPDLHAQLCVEVQEIDGKSYAKTSVGRQSPVQAQS